MAGVPAYAATMLECLLISQPRQYGDDVLRMLVTGGPPSSGGGGIPQRFIFSSRCVPAFRTTETG
jgi:hypothetical protein